MLALAAFVCLRVGCRERGSPEGQGGIGLSRCQFLILETKKTTTANPSFFGQTFAASVCTPSFEVRVGYLVQALSNMVDIGAVQWCGVGRLYRVLPIKSGGCRCCAMVYFGIGKEGVYVKVHTWMVVLCNDIFEIDPAIVVNVYLLLPSL